MEEVFELVRSEKVVLWAGAGLSLYAGYPTANKLADTILKSLSVQEQSLFQQNQQIDSVCEQFIKMKGNKRGPLNLILKKIFQRKPKSLEHHIKLSKIPHLRTIITTNYDSLFEQGYGNKIQVIANPKELNSIDKKQVQLFKIHGDLNHLDKIIISKSDYTNFYNDYVEDVYWTTIKERIINNNIVFVGYSLGDININTIISSISKQLGNDRKKYFLIAPGFPAHEINYLQSHNIEYIDSNGENFINALLLDLRKNIVHDHKTGRIGLDTFNAFLNNHDLVADFLANRNGHTLSAIRSIDHTAKTGLFRIKTDASFVNQLTSFMTGQTLELQLVDQTQFEMSLSGIMILDDVDLVSISFHRQPSVETTFDILFDNGFDLRGVPVKIYYTLPSIIFDVSFKGKRITVHLNMDSETAQISIEYSQPYGNPKDELEAFTLLKYIAEGNPFSIFLQNGKKYPGGINSNIKNSRGIEQYFNYFKMLSEIEKYYQVRFISIDEITDDTFQLVRLLYAISCNPEMQLDFTSYLEGKFDAEAIAYLKERNGEPINDLTIVFDTYRIFVHGQTFTFKQRTLRINDAEVGNLDAVLNGETEMLRITSRTNTASDQYIL